MLKSKNKIMSYFFYKKTILLGSFVSLGLAGCTNNIEEFNVDFKNCLDLKVYEVIKEEDSIAGIEEELIIKFNQELIISPNSTKLARLIFSLNEKGEQLFNSLNFNVLLPEKVQIYQLYRSFLVEMIRFYEYALTDFNCQGFCAVINNATNKSLREFMVNALVRDLYVKNMNEEQLNTLLAYALIYPWDS